MKFELIFAPLEKCKCLSDTSIKMELFVLEKDYCAPDTWIRIEDIDNHFFKRLKSLFIKANFLRTHFVRTIHVPKKFNIALVIPTIKGECATHRNCSQFSHTSLQRNIGSCRSGEFRDD